MATKYYTLWAKPSTVGRKTLDTNCREGYSPNIPRTTLVLGPTRRLTAVKEVLYNPCLPTLRRMDMDEAMRKLTQDHSRHTTPCSKGDFLFHYLSFAYEMWKCRLDCFHSNQVFAYKWEFAWKVILKKIVYPNSSNERTVMKASLKSRWQWHVAESH